MAAVHDAIVAGGMVASLAATVVTTLHRRHVEAFRNAGATSEGAARSLVDLGLRDTRFRKRLTENGVLLSVDGGKYYLALDKWRERQVRGRRIALAVLAGTAIALVAAFALG